MNIVLLLKRGKRESDFIPQEGEPIYTLDTKELLIGDGKTSVKDLLCVCILNNMVKNTNGDLYHIEIDEEGKVEKITPVKSYIQFNNRSQECNFAVKDK